jgi:hypothetical protein
VALTWLCLPRGWNGLDRASSSIPPQKKKKKKYPHLKINPNILTFYTTSIILFYYYSNKNITTKQIFYIFSYKIYFFHSFPRNIFTKTNQTHIHKQTKKKNTTVLAPVQLVPASWQTQPKGLRPLIKAFRVSSLLY